MNILVGVGVTCLLAGVLIGFAIFALVSINKFADEKMAQPDEAFFTPHIDKRV